MPEEPGNHILIEHNGGDNVPRQSPKVKATAPALVTALNNRFVIPASEVASLQQRYDLTEEELLACLIEPASTLARPPISSYHVGSVGIGHSGTLYVGVNLEFPRVPLFNSIHAEQCLLANALHHGEQGLRRIAVSAAPCGHCRQFYSELACAHDIQFYFYGQSHSLDELLPMRFKPSDLLPDPSVPLLMHTQHHAICLTSEAALEPTASTSAGKAAIDKATTSYTPYSKCPSGVALVTKTGEIYCGGYIESAAFNPSMPPLQAAIIDGVTQGLPSYSDIVEAVLVELESGAVRHEETVRMVMKQIAPDAVVTVLKAQWKK